MILEIEKENRNKSGIYKITNKINENLYIGSAKFFIRRFNVHLSTLNKNCHDNKHLQRAYNKYGKDNFIFSILEITKDLHIREQYYIDLFFDNGKKCYNMNNNVCPSSLNLKYKKTFKLISPDNELKIFENYFITDIAKEINVDKAGLYSILSKKNISYFGWRLPENKDYDYKNWRKYCKGERKSKFYNVKLLSPDGNVYGPIQNIHEFCRVHNIKNPSHIFNIIAKRTKYVNGWSLYNGSLEKPSVRNSKLFNVKLISPEGNIFGPILNLTKFCKEKNINVSCIRNLISGKIKKGNYKGWVLQNNC